MTEDELVKEARKLNRWERHKFMVLVIITIVISLFLVMISLRLYASSGAAQLDLSRPGYKSVRDQVSRPADVDYFPSTGSIDQEALNNFRVLYDKQAGEVTAHSSFGGDVMSDQALGFDLESQ